MTVYRGLPSVPAKEIVDNPKCKPGAVIQTDEFLSTSATESVAEGFKNASREGIMLHILAPAGSRASHVAPHGDAPEENEVLVGRGSQFVIEKWDARARVLTLRLANDQDE